MPNFRGDTDLPMYQEGATRLFGQERILLTAWLLVDNGRVGDEGRPGGRRSVRPRLRCRRWEWRRVGGCSLE